MASYRAYILKADGHFKGVLEFECADDDQALAAARRAGSEHGLELWAGPRRLTRLPARTSDRGPSRAA